MRSPRQPPLFARPADAAEPAERAEPAGGPGAGDAAAAADAAADALVVIAAGGQPLGKQQQNFNRLTARLRTLRGELAAWRQFETLHRQRLASELAPARQALLAGQRELLLWLDAFLAAPPRGERLTRGHRDRLVALVCSLADSLLQAAGDDAELVALFDRHSRRTWAALRQDALARAAAVFGAVLGEDLVPDPDATSIDDLLRQAGERVHARRDAQAEQMAQRRAARQARGGKPSKSEQANARQAQALQDASASVREVYRKLASSLHPDREPDAAERARKTVLMQRVNQAYAQNDLLGLLAMQIEIEQIDASHLAQASEERLRHYCRVLQAQQRALQQELAAVLAPFRASTALPRGVRTLTPQCADADLSRDVAELHAALAALRADAARLRDPAQRPAFLRGLRLDDLIDRGDPADALDELLRSGLFDAAGGGRRR